MSTKKRTLLFALLLNLSILSVPLFLYQVSFSEPAADRRFPKEIAKVQLPKLLDFGKSKCIPCKAMAPILKELSDEYKGPGHHQDN